MKAVSQEIVLNSGRQVTSYTLTNDKGMSITAITLGATLTHIMVPDAEGKLENVILTWKDLNVYEKHPGSFNAIIGRIAGRIHKGQVTLEGKTYQIPVNSTGNSLHGGKVGFHLRDWQGEVKEGKEEIALSFTYLSKDGEEGFPGNLKVKVTYLLTNENELTITYEATTDKQTVVNLTNHAYFNLSGNAKRSILDEEVYIDSDTMYDLDAQLIPTGKIIPLDEAPYFDFRKPKLLGQDIDKEDTALAYGLGYDHIWRLNQGEKAITLYDSISKRCMTITTSEPGVVMYTMNHADDPILLENGEPQKMRFAVCFETQKGAIGYNEVNKEEVILNPSENYKSSTTFSFSIK